MGQGGIVRGVGTTAAGRQTGLNSKHRKQEEGLYSRAAGDGWSMDGGAWWAAVHGVAEG